jgi:hypothetical protein
MKHAALALVTWFSVWCSPVVAGSWADTIFSKKNHDFGSVPRGADVRCEFIVQNHYGIPVGIAGLKRTCGCTEVKLDDSVVLNEQVSESSVRKVLQPGQKATIRITLGTRKFIKEKSSEITVFFDQPKYAAVRLTVKSYIRQDVVLNPGAIQFGTVSRGEAKSKSLDIEYAGQVDWRIVGLTVGSLNLDVRQDELYRKAGRVGYKLTVALKPSMPIGVVHDVVLIRTNDPAIPEVPVIVEGQLLPDLIVTPSNFNLGSVKPSELIRKNVLLRSKKPFRIVEVAGTDSQFHAEFVDREQTFHTVTFSFMGSDSMGDVVRRFVIKTDLPDEPPVELKASVRVVR